MAARRELMPDGRRAATGGRRGCRGLSDDCDQRADGDRGALRRCGCAKITCEHGCEETGEPAFACR
ncbi:hypothetical protein [Sorangium sp. So ce1000]|uniref:hypothetical protein n=1 Tax=Sorangium sp. So ce1000 TaxID=3133325 RepID=UPI003F647ABE